MRAVVFGGAGFLGSHVADALTERGHDVTIFDIRESPYLRDGQTMTVGDILDAAAVSAACGGAEAVYNFAGIASLDDARTMPAETVRLNVLGNINVLEGAREAGVERFVYASSIYVYSQKGGFYRCSKQASEVYVEEYQRRFGLDFTILRYGTLYGPRADEHNSIHRYLKAARETGRIEVSGTGEEMREYINVRDAATLSADILAPEFANSHIILTGHHPTKFKEMLAVIAEVLGSGVEVVFSEQEYPDHYSYTPYSFAPSIGKKLVCNPYTDLGQGILDCLQDMYGRDLVPGGPQGGGTE